MCAPRAQRLDEISAGTGKFLGRTEVAWATSLDNLFKASSASEVPPFGRRSRQQTSDAVQMNLSASSPYYS